MRLLFVASAPMEFRGLLKFVQPQAELRPPLIWSRQGHINGHEILMVANGAGSGRAAAAVEAAIGAFPPEAIISTGFCGALDPAFAAGSVVVGTQIRGASSFPCQPVSSPKPSKRGIVASVDHVVQSSAEKRALRAAGASVVEMEAAGVAARAQALGLPLYCVRAVTDTAGEDLANDFNAALREDGQFATMRIFSHALSRPVARVPELFRLGGNCLRAAKALGDFFAYCQF